MQKTKLPLLIFFYLIFFVNPKPVSAALIDIPKEGVAVVNVLSSTTQLEYPEVQALEITKASHGENQKLANVSLLKEEGDKISLKIETSEGSEKKFDITNFNEEIIEIEEVQASKKIKILQRDGIFVIQQGQWEVSTAFPIFINPENKHVSVETDSGVHHLGVFPKEAIDNLQKANILDSVSNITDPESGIFLEEGSLGGLAYKISGMKNINVLNLFDYSAPIKVHVSASDGKVFKVDKPKWVSILGFLLDSAS